MANRPQVNVVLDVLPKDMRFQKQFYYFPRAYSTEVAIKQESKSRLANELNESISRFKYFAIIIGQYLR